MNSNQQNNKDYIAGLEHDGAEPHQAYIFAQRSKENFSKDIFPREDVTYLAPLDGKGTSQNRTSTTTDVPVADQCTDLQNQMNNLQLAPAQELPEKRPNSVDLAQKYLEAVVEYTNKLYEQDEDGDSKLHLAIIQEALNDIDHIIQNTYIQECLNMQNKLGQTALHLAIIVGQFKVVRILLACGANPSMQDTEGRTPLHIACERGDLDAVTALTRPLSRNEKRIGEMMKYPVLHHEVPLNNIMNYEGELCIHKAAQAGRSDIIDHLVDKCGHNINAQEMKSGKTILHFSVETENENLLQYLLNRPDIDEDVEDFNGHGARLLAHYHPRALAIIHAVFPAEREVLRHNFVELIDEDTNYLENRR